MSGGREPEAPEPASDVECPTCGGPTENGNALEGWPFEWEVASKLRAALATAREENERLAQTLTYAQGGHYMATVARADCAEAAVREWAERYDEQQAALERYRTTYRDADTLMSRFIALSGQMDNGVHITAEHALRLVRREARAALAKPQAHHEQAADGGCEHCAKAEGVRDAAADALLFLNPHIVVDGLTAEVVVGKLRAALSDIAAIPQDDHMNLRPKGEGNGNQPLDG